MYVSSIYCGEAKWQYHAVLFRNATVVQEKHSLSSVMTTGTNANYLALLKQSDLFLCGLDYCSLFLNVVERSVKITKHVK